MVDRETHVSNYCDSYLIFSGFANNRLIAYFFDDSYKFQKYCLFCGRSKTTEECYDCQGLLQRFSAILQPTVFPISNTRETVINFYNDLFSSYPNNRLQSMKKRKIRILSLFDGIATRNALRKKPIILNMGFKEGFYTAKKVVTLGTNHQKFFGTKATKYLAAIICWVSRVYTSNKTKNAWSWQMKKKSG